MTDSEYIDGIMTNNQSVMTDLYNSYCNKFVSYFGKQFSKSIDDSMDLFHESYKIMYENIKREKLTQENLSSSLYSYLVGIGKLKMMSDDRKNHTLDTVSIDNVDENGNSLLNKKDKDNINEYAISEELEREKEEKLKFLERAIELLPPPCNQLLTLFYWNRKSIEEIMHIMGQYKNTDSVKTQKSKCMNKLKSFKEKYYN